MGIIKLDGYVCERCRHQWVPRSKTNELPVICPKCKSPYWNKPRNKLVNKKLNNPKIRRK